MTYRGRVEKGWIVLEGGTNLRLFGRRAPARARSEMRRARFMNA